MMLSHVCLGFRVAVDAFYRFNAYDGWAIASHIALSTLMALFPFLIVLTSLAGFFGSKELADQAAGRQSGEGVAFADEVGLVEIAEVVDDIGPGPAWGAAAGRKRPVEPDRPGKQLGRHPDLDREAAPELAGAKAGVGDEVFYPRAAALGDHPA